VKFEGVASFSFKTNISPKIPPWAFALNGYRDDLGISPMYGLGFGYQFIKAFRSDITIEYRPTYSYRRFQITPLSPLGNRTRKFRLSNLSFFLNGYLCFEGFNGAYKTHWVTIAPFIGAGIGISYNEVRNFHSISKATLGRVFSMMADRLKAALSAQAQAGLDFTWPHWAIGIGYRFFYGGKFKTANYFLDNPNDDPIGAEGVTFPSWKGRLMSNEAFLNLRYIF
jgi:hypothetical protein